MNPRTDIFTRVILLAIAVLLGVIALHPLFDPGITAQAQGAKFDHVVVVSAVFLYHGRQGLLLADKRNGNIWFMPRVDEKYIDPVFVMRLELEKLDRPPQ
jgi:hypothetical protein